MNTQLEQSKKHLPTFGVGLGYRPQIASSVLGNRDSIDFVEVVTENYLDVAPAKLKEIDNATAAGYRIIPHGVDLSIGSVDDLDEKYLASVQQFVRLIDAPWWSDHLCFTGVGGAHLHDLLPLPFSREAITHVVKRVKKVQQAIELPFLLENISAYLRMPGSEMTEAQFIAEVVEQADCGLLLDVNNVYVNSKNHNYDPFEFIDQLPIDRVVQIHIAGHKKRGSMIVDTHGARIANPVFDLLAYVLKRTEVKAILLERDQYFPKFSSVVDELNRIKSVVRETQPQLLKSKESLVSH